MLGVECSSLYEVDNGVGSGSDSDRPGALVGSPSVCVSADSNWLTIESSDIPFIVQAPASTLKGLPTS